MRGAHEKIIDTEHANENKEFERMQERHRIRLETYKKNQDAVLEKLHAKYAAAQEDYDKKNS
jgi:hypothetical protein